MRIGQIAYVNIVPYGCAVRRSMIQTEQWQPWAAAGRPDDEWNEVRFRVVRLAELAVGVSSRGVEVAKGGPTQPGYPAIPAEDALDK